MNLRAVAPHADTHNHVLGPAPRVGEAMSPTRDSRGTQILLLRILLLARGGWVRLHTDSVAHIRKLRRLEFRIPAPRVEMVDGKRDTWYRIELGWGSESARKGR
jgi:hypothetical protein